MKPSVLVATALAELFRPIFHRWAGNAPRALYERIMEELWSGSVDETWPDTIDLLPEAHFDDSNHPNYYVMLGLGVLYYAAKVAQHPASAEDADVWRDFDGVVDALANDIAISETVEQVRRAAEGLSVVELRAMAISHAQTIDLALDVAAREYGWTAGP